MHIRRAGKRQSRLCFQTQPTQPKRLFNSSRQLQHGRTLHRSANDPRSPYKHEGIVTSHDGKKSFATHQDPRPPTQDELLSLLRPRRQGKVDIKTKLRAWQQDYDKSDEALRPYISGLSPSTSIRAKTINGVDVVRNLRHHQVSGKDEDEDYDYGNELEDATLVGPGDIEGQFLKKGDLAELSSRGIPTLSVFLRAIGTEHEFLTINGILTHQSVTSVHMTISPFVPPEQLTPLLNQLPAKMSGEEDVDTWAPRETSAPLIRAMLDFDRTAKDFYQQHASKIDDVYNSLADQKEYRYMTVREITAHVVNEPDSSKVKPAHLLAVHQALMRAPVGFNISDRYHRFSHNFEIVPKRTVEVFQKALVWLRDLQEASMNQVYSKNSETLPFRVEGNPIGVFLVKARTLIANSRLHRPVTRTGRVGPDSGTTKRVQDAGDYMKFEKQMDFTPDEECLVKFIRFWALQPHVRGPYATTLDALGSRLVRATGCYDDFEVNRSTGCTFLQEIGVILPWDSRPGYTHRALLKDYFPGLSVDRMWQEATGFVKRWKREKPVDVMQELRVDWGSTEVFSIDPQQTSVVDDGLSVEQVPDEPEKYWLHTHIANPTAFIQPDSPPAQYAKEVGQTIHFPERTSHMMHPDVAMEHFSVGPKRPVLTFSAKLDLDGNLCGTRISSGIIHNHIRLDRESCQEALYPGSTEKVPVQEHVMGELPGPQKTPIETRQVNEDHLAKVRLIQKLASLHALKRPNWDVLRYRENSAKVNVGFPMNVHATFRHREDPITSTRYYGDPQIRVLDTGFDPQASMHTLVELDKVVDDTMILACEVAALWCKERNIPSVYRGTTRNNEIIPPEQFKERIIKPALERTGNTPFIVIQEYARRATGSFLSSYPVPHEALGTEAYLRVTSPLRRYSELIAHWQIEAALRYEHATGESLVGCEYPDPFLPFPRQKIEALFPHLIERDRVSKLAASQARLSWIAMFFFRAHYFGEGNLPPTLKVFIRRHYTASIVLGTLEMINVDVKVEETEVSKAEGNLQLGDWWECRIVDVETYNSRITVQPVRLVERIARDLCLDLQSRIEVNPHAPHATA